ncbi:hypothetical protein [Clostridium botulinum]|uniref:Uncharacterized protein n=1 Tax=Clostridium botulinum CFSAN001627 TaxID=1232189 RepID=M1ZXK7_CLOBO|nr:hypothetical protein [Clostridium botulinum]EKN41855.1 hypothetical protein CFSAN001627_10508 [Clostridium botulinum CFSAN001627]APC85481.1 hypothetical protein NPD12_154 [Clostridium botulinum]AXG96616.1 hypothetical protein AGE31_13535 [Clostridium botulinum]EDT80003.1 hypothetical protein CBN_0013 [Clostridium botulinum NCTC 2916]MBY6773773.1 hypothetical protein [Clostridium botulinum]
MSIKKLVLTGILTLSISAPVFAAWNYASITLPRTGAWATISRGASGASQKTQVTRNAYTVNSRIINNGGTVLSGWQSHSSGTGTIRTHYSGVKKGDSVKAQFKTNATNVRTTTATIGWQP